MDRKEEETQQDDGTVLREDVIKVGLPPIIEDKFGRQGTLCGV